MDHIREIELGARVADTLAWADEQRELYKDDPEQEAESLADVLSRELEDAADLAEAAQEETL